jgi:protein-glutamine gamma-glutamyltransferase
MLNRFVQRWHQLPGETQSTLFLLVVIAVVVAPQLIHLPWWCTAMLALVLVWRAVLAWRAQPLPGRMWLVLTLAGAVLATWLSYRTLLGRDAGTTLLVVLLALKTLEMKAQRDAFVVFFLGFFCLLSNFLYSQSLPVALAMVVGLAGLLTSLVNAQLLNGEGRLKAASAMAWRLMAMGAPVMLVLFMVFPRVAPLWGVPGTGDRGKTGLSPDMQVGRIAQLAQDSRIAFRVKFDGAPPPQDALYFRGPVLTLFDGQRWTEGASRPVPPDQDLPVTPLGPELTYEITLEPHMQPWVLVLDATVKAPQVKGYTVRGNDDLQWSATRPIDELVRYRASSHLRYAYGPTRPVQSLYNALVMPQGSNPRTQALADEIRRTPGYENADAKALVSWVLHRLSTQGYRYTLEPGLFGPDTADEFWFDKKEGFCEHIASSVVILMRSLGVPARVVTGYLGGEINPVDQYWTVRQSDAHAWVEVWQAASADHPGGWIRVDPTAAVAPQRLNSLSRLSPRPGPIADAVPTWLGPAPVGWLAKVRSIWDATNNAWNQKVLSYSQDKQLELLKDIGFQSPSLADLGPLLAGSLLAVLALTWLWRKWTGRSTDPWMALWQWAQAELNRQGAGLDSGLTPRQAARQIKRRWGSAADPVVQWLLALEAVRYAPAQPDKTAALVSQLKKSWPRSLPSKP